MSKRFKLGIYAGFTLEKFFTRESRDNIVIFELIRIFFRFYASNLRILSAMTKFDE